MTNAPRPDIAEEVFAALSATWPAARTRQVGDWVVREGDGGGKRVSSAYAPEGLADPNDLSAVMDAPLAMVRDSQPDLAARCADLGWREVDPTVLFAAPLQDLAVPPPLVTSFISTWPPLQIAREMWEAQGIGPARQAVMERAEGPKISVLGRCADKPAGVAFVALDGPVAMVHALEVLPDIRRNGAASNMMRAAAVWAQDQGAETLAVAVTHANVGGKALYASLNMSAVGHYSYWRQHPDETG